MSRAARWGKSGGAAGKKRASKPVGGPSEAWQNVIDTSIRMCELVGTIDEESSEPCMEQAAMLAECKKERLNHQMKMGLLDSIMGAIQDYMLALSSLDEAKAEQIQVGPLIVDLYNHLIALVKELIEAAGGDDEAETKAQTDAEEEAVFAIKVLDTLIVATVFQSKYAKKVVAPHYATLIRYCLSIGVPNVRGDEVREAAIALCGNMIEANPAQITADNMVEELVEACYTLCSDPDDDQLDPSQFSSQNLGTQHLDILAMNFKTVVAPLVVKQSLELLKDGANYTRKAGLVCLAVLPEACTEYVSESATLASIMAPIQAAMVDNDELVRSAAYIALAEYLEHVSASATYHTAVLTEILNTLKNSSTPLLVKTKSCIPLIQLCLHLPESALENPDSADNIVIVLLNMIKQVRTSTFAQKDECELVESLIICIRSIASTHVNKFKPFAPQVLEVYLSIMKETDSLWHTARGNASSSIGVLASSLGKEGITPHMETITNLLVSGMDLEHYGLRAATHSTWGQLAAVLGEDILSSLPSVTPFIARVLDSTYGRDEEQEMDEDFEEEPEENAEAEEERKFALICYKAFIDTLKEAFVPFHERLFEVLFEHGREYTDEIKGHAAQVMASFPLLYPLKDTPWTAGTNVTLPDNAKNVLSKVKQILMFYIHYGTDPFAVEESLEAMQNLLTTYGQVIVMDDPNSLKTLTQLATRLLERKAFCQLQSGGELPDDDLDAGAQFEDGEDEDEEDFEDEDDEDGEDVAPRRGGRSAFAAAGAAESGAAIPASVPHTHGAECGANCEEGDDSGAPENLYRSTLDLLTALAKARGASFQETFATLFPVVQKTAKDPKFYALTYCFVADVAEVLADKYLEYVKQLLPSLFELLSSHTDHSTSRNGAYALGSILLKAGPDQLVDFYSQIVSTLSAIMKETETYVEQKTEGMSEEDKEKREDALGCRDNVVSALGKLLMVGAKQIDLTTVLPLFISGLPLNEDFEEANTVYTCCIKLMNTFPTEHPGVIDSNVVKLFNVLVTALSQPIDAKLKSFVAKNVETFSTSNAAVQAEVAGWAAEKKASYEAALKAANEAKPETEATPATKTAWQ